MPSVGTSVPAFGECCCAWGSEQGAPLGQAIPAPFVQEQGVCTHQLHELCPGIRGYSPEWLCLNAGLATKRCGAAGGSLGNWLDQAPLAL